MPAPPYRPIICIVYKNNQMIRFDMMTYFQCRKFNVRDDVGIVPYEYFT
ncbi:MAG: hypothetical protein RSD32_08355 [Oscillospiraceae bacterium]